MEQWKDIPGYEGIYQASTEGRIRTGANKTTSNVRYHSRIWKQRVLKQRIHPNKRGRTDARVNLWKDGKESTRLVSRLVAMTWCEGYSPELTVNHIDGNPLNNRADNLEWLSRACNIAKAFEDGLYSRCHPIRLKGGNMIFHHNSMAEASRSLGRCDSYIHNCLRKGRPIVSTTGTRYEVI